MSFILRIFFSGLIAFLPSKDGKQVTVLLLDSSHSHHAANGPVIPEHRSMLLARGASCKGTCPRSNGQISQFLYPDADSSASAAKSLAHAVSGGAIWQLSGSDLSVNSPKDGVTVVHVASADGKEVPDTVAERADFRWVANLKEIDPDAGAIDPAVFTKNPPPGLIVGRFELTSGRLSTQSVIQIDGKVTPIEFRPLDGGGAHPYVRAAANWVEAEIKMPGNSVTISETDFSGGKKRSMTLAPENGVVELALLNISRPLHPVANAKPRPGAHFVRFWDLYQHPPAAAERPLPQLARTAVPQRDYDALHPDAPARVSVMLREIFPYDRGPYDQLLCPVGQP